MLYDDLLEQLETPPIRRKPRGSDRSRPRRWEDYLYTESDHLPRKSKQRPYDDDVMDDDRRERRRDPHWKRRRED